MADDKVQVHHPKLPEGRDNPQLMSRRAFEKVWRHRGWRIVPKGTARTRNRKKES